MKDNTYTFQKLLLHPDKEAIERRDKYFKQLDSITIAEREDGTFIADIPDLKLENLE